MYKKNRWNQIKKLIIERMESEIKKQNLIFEAKIDKLNTENRNLGIERERFKRNVEM